jgi:hypothetical protein
MKQKQTLKQTANQKEMQIRDSNKEYENESGEEEHQNESNFPGDRYCGVAPPTG